MCIQDMLNIGDKNGSVYIFQPALSSEGRQNSLLNAQGYRYYFTQDAVASDCITVARVDCMVLIYDEENNVP